MLRCLHIQLFPSPTGGQLNQEQNGRLLPFTCEFLLSPNIFPIQYICLIRCRFFAVVICEIKSCVVPRGIGDLNVSNSVLCSSSGDCLSFERLKKWVPLGTTSNQPRD